MLALPPPAYLFHTKAGVRNLLYANCLSIQEFSLHDFISKAELRKFTFLILNWILGTKFDSCPSLMMISYLKRGLWYANNFEWIFIAAAALLMEHSAFLYWNFLLHIFPCTKRKFPAASLKGAPQKSTTFKGHEDWELRVKREKQIAHICSDDDAKKCLLINLIMVINCHQIPLLRWASENSKPANVSKARKIFSYLTS